MKRNSFTSKLANRLSTLSVATFVSLGAGLGIAGGASAIGFNGLAGYAGATFVRAIGGTTVSEPPEKGENGTATVNPTDDSKATIDGPDTGLNAPSYIDWYLTPTTGDIQIKFSYAFDTVDFDTGNDAATYYTIAGAYNGNPGTKLIDPGQILPPTTQTGVVTVPIAMGDTFVFRVSSTLNDGNGAGTLTISEFEVIPFDFAPTYGVIFVGTALGINEWRKKRQASKKDETEEKL